MEGSDTTIETAVLVRQASSKGKARREFCPESASIAKVVG
jgi:hypothetical protein